MKPTPRISGRLSEMLSAAPAVSRRGLGINALLPAVREEDVVIELEPRDILPPPLPPPPIPCACGNRRCRSAACRRAGKNARLFGFTAHKGATR